MTPDEALLPNHIGKRALKYSIVERKDLSASFLRILAKGDVESYIASIITECMKD